MALQTKSSPTTTSSSVRSTPRTESRVSVVPSAARASSTKLLCAVSRSYVSVTLQTKTLSYTGAFFNTISEKFHPIVGLGKHLLSWACIPSGVLTFFASHIFSAISFEDRAEIADGGVWRPLILFHQIIPLRKCLHWAWCFFLITRSLLYQSFCSFISFLCLCEMSLGENV